MLSSKEASQGTPDIISGNEGPSFLTYIRVGKEIFPLHATKDFSPDDPWSKGMRTIIFERSPQFRDKPFYEFGIGDARNVLTLIHAGSSPSNIVGVELDPWRMELADKNLREANKNLEAAGYEEVPYDLIQADAVEWLRGLGEGKKLLEGNAVLCLPQAPMSGAENHADGYDGDNLPKEAQGWNRYGLGLNAAVLSGLSTKVKNGFRTFAMFSGRVPRDVLDKMFDEAGWEVVYRHDAGMAQQDPDTSVAYTEAFDTYNPEDPNSTALFYELEKGEGEFFNPSVFYRLAGDGDLLPISAQEAEERRGKARREESTKPGAGRSGLNVYHELVVVELQLKEKEEPIFDIDDLWK